MNFNLKKIMIKKILKHDITQKITGLLIAYYLKICFHTSEWKIKNDDTINTLLKKKKNNCMLLAQ